MRWNREQWAATFTGDHKLYLLEERGPVAIFKSQLWRWVRDNLFADSPIYTVWDGDEMIYCGMSYREARNKLEELTVT